MKVLRKNILGALLLMSAAASAETVGYVGFAPLTVGINEITAQGSGKNMYLECAIKLDPTATPYLENLKGCQVVGVRCYLRTDYKQKLKGFSTVNLYEGSLEAEPVRKTVNFTEGWNEVMFDEPYTLGGEPIYVGYRVFELMGDQSLPVVSYKNASVSGGYYICANREEWQETTDRGTLLVQAIVSDPSGKAFTAPGAAAHASQAPRIVAPDAPFEGAFYIHNFSYEPISSVTVNTSNPTRSYSITLPKAIPAFESALVSTDIYTGTEEGLDVALTSTVTEINGKEAPAAHLSTTRLYVSYDNFIRVPLIEEYTSLSCVNCPFMSYFLDKGRETFGQPHVFVTHHCGFRYDAFTQRVDKELEYMFFGSMGNPYATYDRTILPGQVSLMIGARTADVEPYTEYITAANEIPAIASVNVKVDADGSVKVDGRIKLGEKLADGKVYLSTYLIEDHIPRGTQYPQTGVDTELNPDSPADLYDTYQHNGVIRHNFCTEALGDPVSYDAEGNYSVSYPAATYAADWNKANCHVVAFLHRINKEDPRDNYVLNAGDSKPFADAGINAATLEEGPDALRYVVTSDRRILVTTAARAVRLFTLSGQEMAADAQLSRGVYLLQVTLPSGTIATRKLAL
ncbi:MAG: Omp28-related outer membrane protein [Bacteroides sp.]|nr:Omp28-related outer membrane protein [Bacteroides sp.]MCM1378644.1 Omp28-related outer membrane protein [Bacteroides sp.]MCM1446382.1 Omp28-related outer membrane protein [Prevotella sp.]